MTNSKAFSLLSGLTEKELAACSKAIKIHKRKTLQKLYKVLLSERKKKEPEQTVVYQQVFGKPYAKGKDYIIRNEYRLLYDWLLNQIYSYHTQKSEISTDYMLQYFLKNGLHELFEEEFKSTWKTALAEDNTKTLLTLSDLNLNYYLTAKTQNLDNALKITELAQKRLALLQVDFLRNMRKEEIRIKLSERIISAYKLLPEPYKKQQTVNLTALEQNDLYAQYLSKRAAINFARGQDKIQMLENIISEEDVIRKYEPEPDESICRFLINLGQEHYLNSNFSKAVKYFDLAYRQINKVSPAVEQTLVTNYTLALMRNQQFSKAECLAKAHTELLLSSELVGGRAPFLLSVLHLYTRNVQAAEKYVSLETKKYGTEFYYFIRLVLSATYYLRGDIDLAVREAINIEQAVNYELNREQNFQTQISKPIVSNFRKFYQTINKKAKTQKEELKKLGKEIEKSIEIKSDQSGNSILSQWLIHEIQQLTIHSSR
ncbi:MAG: hypothetical protein U0T74_07140 [Chitinophagales bacterium]